MKQQLLMELLLAKKSEGVCPEKVNLFLSPTPLKAEPSAGSREDMSQFTAAAVTMYEVLFRDKINTMG